MLNATSTLAALAPHFAAVQLPDLAGVLLTTAIFTVFGLLVFGPAQVPEAVARADEGINLAGCARDCRRFAWR